MGRNVPEPKAAITTEGECGMSIEHPTATDLWSARTAVSITVAQAHRQQADADRELVEKLQREVTELRAELYAAQVHASDRDALADERNELQREVAELTEALAMALVGCAEAVRKAEGERDRARDLAVRSGIFQGDNELLNEVYALTAERDQAIYDRDSGRARNG